MVNQRLMLPRTSLRQGLCLARNACAAIALALLFCTNSAFAQFSSEDAPRPIVAPEHVSLSEQASSPQMESDSNDQTRSSSVPTSLDASSLGDSADVKQSKRILWIFPNYRAVSANTQLPPLSLREKFWLATQDSFDYSSFITAGILAGVSQANKSYPEFWTRRQRLWSLLLACRGRPGGWKLSNGSHRACGDARRPAILHARTRRVFQALRLCGEPPTHHADRFQRSNI